MVQEQKSDLQPCSVSMEALNYSFGEITIKEGDCSLSSVAMNIPFELCLLEAMPFVYATLLLLSTSILLLQRQIYKISSLKF